MKNCKNCKYQYEIEKIKLFPGGVEHVYLDGFACIVRTEDREKVEWLEDVNINEFSCDRFIPKKEQPYE